MPTKTDRILSYLPGTFKPARRMSALRAFVDAFGNELQWAENSLAGLMRAHWVDHADRGAEVIDDLARFAALYGLAPRDDEDVEEFREHLKRYVRTFLEGTVTVQGALRVTAEALGLRIEDANEALDSWWRREGDVLSTVDPRGDDAAEQVFGFREARASGQPDRPAEFISAVNVSGGVDLRGASTLRLQIDEAAPVDIDLAAAVPDAAAATLNNIRDAINDAMGMDVARHDGMHLALASPTIGPDSHLIVNDVPGDAADLLLGLPPRGYRGANETSASVTGNVDLSDGADLTEERYLRIAIDETHLAEIDCAGPNPAATSLDQIRNAINSALGIDVATDNGRFLTLTSPTSGAGSSIAFHRPAAQDATRRLFGDVNSFYLGRDAQPARVTGRRDLRGGVDLSGASIIRLRVDGEVVVTIDCAGDAPANTRLDDIVDAINDTLGVELASHDGQFVELTSPAVGALSEIIFETPPEGEATEIIFGLPRRDFHGAAAMGARIAGLADLSDGVDLMARRWLQLAVDGGAPIEIDLRSTAADPRAVALGELTDAINAAAGPGIASDDDAHLLLASPTIGGGSSLEIAPLETIRRRRFVTRARVIDEAAREVFGFVAREAKGTPAAGARIDGKKDLSRGVDLRTERYLRISIDGGPAREVDCAGTRPRATLLNEVVDAINNEFLIDLASHDGASLSLASPSVGEDSRVALEPTRATDALDSVLGTGPVTVNGREASGVTITGTVDLSAGIDLPAGAAVKLGLDGETPAEISLAGEEAVHKTLNQIVLDMNLALGSTFARHDGKHIIIMSAKTGVESQLVFEVPDGEDVTVAVFGIQPPRAYHGVDAVPARVIGSRDVSGRVDLSVARLLRLTVDRYPRVDVDCAARAADPASASPEEIVESINEGLKSSLEGFTADVATTEGGRIILTSPGTGASARLVIEAHSVGDARERLLGAVAYSAAGTAPSPAEITGEVELLGSVDLSERGAVRLAVDGGRPVDIDVAGATPDTTLPDEIVFAINEVFPGTASLTADNQLRLTSPARGFDSRISLLPLRHLEVVEYPALEADQPPRPVGHSDAWFADNDGAADAAIEPAIAALQGVVGAALINWAVGWRVRLLHVLSAGERVELRADPWTGIRAIVSSVDGETREVDGSELLVGPMGSQAWVPFTDTRTLRKDAESAASYQLNNPLAPAIVRLRARSSFAHGPEIQITVAESDLTAAPVDMDDGSAQLSGRVRSLDSAFILVDKDETVIAHLHQGPGVDLPVYVDRAVLLKGALHAGDPPLIIVRWAALLFDVYLRSELASGDVISDPYPGVTIGNGAAGPHSLVWQINAGSQSSQLVKAEELAKGTVLHLPRERSYWQYLDCDDSRFDQAEFDQAEFAGGLCLDRGVFNVSRFANAPPDPLAAVFAPSDLPNASSAEVSLRWWEHEPGAFQVNLPVDLRPRFGARFNQSRFSLPKSQTEVYEGVVTEPDGDPQFIVDRINAESDLVVASVVGRVPLGWDAVPVPFRRPQFLTLGAEEEAACLYLAEEGFDDFIRICAKPKGDEHSGPAGEGEWGNEIAVTARKSGPAMYDVAIGYAGGRFENARQVVMGPELPTLVHDILQPGPVGVLQAKAAGVRVEATRDGIQHS